MMTNYSNKYFGKDIMELSNLDIENFFTIRREESDKIEFKAFSPKYGNAKKNLEGVIKAICAFLNSNGGLLIWGAPIEIKNGEIETFQGELSPVPELIEKDVLISKVSDSISPLPVGIVVNIVKIKGGYVYIFEIEKSNYSPHQFKNIYYARLDGQTKPAPHYLVDALFKRVTYPNIEGYLNFDHFGSDKDGEHIILSAVLINFSPLINEHDVRFRIICPQAKFMNRHLFQHGQQVDMDGQEYINNEKIKTLHFGSPEVDTLKIGLKIDDIIEKHNGCMDFLLFFGGRNSPLKVSQYKLRLDNSWNPDELYRNLIKIDENVLMIDKQKELGSTRESLLERLLKR